MPARVKKYIPVSEFDSKSGGANNYAANQLAHPGLRLDGSIKVDAADVDRLSGHALVKGEGGKKVVKALKRPRPVFTHARPPTCGSQREPAIDRKTGNMICKKNGKTVMAAANRSYNAHKASGVKKSGKKEDILARWHKMMDHVRTERGHAHLSAAEKEKIANKWWAKYKKGKNGTGKNVFTRREAAIKAISEAARFGVRRSKLGERNSQVNAAIKHQHKKQEDAKKKEEAKKHREAAKKHVHHTKHAHKDRAHKAHKDHAHKDHPHKDHAHKDHPKPAKKKTSFSQIAAGARGLFEKRQTRSSTKTTSTAAAKVVAKSKAKAAVASKQKKSRTSTVTKARKH